jgi:hypothetical protein
MLRLKSYRRQQRINRVISATHHAQRNAPLKPRGGPFMLRVQQWLEYFQRALCISRAATGHSQEEQRWRVIRHRLQNFQALLCRKHRIRIEQLRRALERDFQRAPGLRLGIHEQKLPHLVDEYE